MSQNDHITAMNLEEKGCLVCNVLKTLLARRRYYTLYLYTSPRGFHCALSASPMKSL